MKWNRKQMAWMRTAAKGRVTLYRCCAGPELNFAPRYLPRLGGSVVSFAKRRPRYGWLTPEDAIRDGNRYRESCRKQLAAISSTSK